MMRDLLGLMVRVSQLETIIGQLAMVGPVAVRDAEKGYRLKLGTDADGNDVLSPWQPHPESTKTSVPLPLGQTVGFLNPTGDPRQGFMVRSGYSEANPSPNADLEANVFEAGGVRIVAANGTLSITADSAVTVTVGGVTHRITEGGVEIVGGEVRHDGQNVGSTHVHGGVTRGGALTNGPQ